MTPAAAGTGVSAAARAPHRVFAPGDALFFNLMSLHRSGLDPAVESWFFAPSTCPSEQIPMLF